jgi:hypothetical protein
VIGEEVLLRPDPVSKDSSPRLPIMIEVSSRTMLGGWCELPLVDAVPMPVLVEVDVLEPVATDKREIFGTGGRINVILSVVTFSSRSPSSYKML